MFLPVGTFHFAFEFAIKCYAIQQYKISLFSLFHLKQLPNRPWCKYTQCNRYSAAVLWNISRGPEGAKVIPHIPIKQLKQFTKKMALNDDCKNFILLT